MSVRAWSKRLLTVAAIAGTGAFLFGTGADAAPKQGKDIRVTVPDAFAGDTTNYTFRITNETGTQQVGSANVQIPAEIRLGTVHTASVTPGTGTAAPSPTDARVIELRNLNIPPTGANNYVDVTINGLEMPCTGTISQWGVTAKQSNDYSGLPGNALSIAASSDLTTGRLGQCSLDFQVQPTGAKFGDAIRGTAFQPSSGAPVAIQARDANGGETVPGFSGPVTLGVVSSAPGSLTIGAGDPVLDNGVLRYSALSINEAGSYEIAAAKSGYISAVSQPFPIVDALGVCDATSCDEFSITGNRASVALRGGTTNGAAGHLVLSNSVGTRPDCAGYTSPMGQNEWYEFATTVATDKVLRVTYTKAAMKTVTGGANALEICMSSPESFVTKGGSALTNYDDFDGNNLDGFVGLLADCVGYNPLDPPAEPCIIERSNVAGGGAQVLISAPDSLGDPRLR